MSAWSGQGRRAVTRHALRAFVCGGLAMSCYVSGCWTLVNEAFPYPEQSRRLSAAMHLCLALSGLFLVPLVFWGGARGVSFLRGLSSLGGRAAFLALTAVSFIMGAAGALGIMTLLDHLNEQGII